MLVATSRSIDEAGIESTLERVVVSDAIISDLVATPVTRMIGHEGRSLATRVTQAVYRHPVYGRSNDRVGHMKDISAGASSSYRTPFACAPTSA